MPYRFAIIGCGNVSQRHAVAIQQVGSLAAVCDPDEQRAFALGSAFSCPWFTTIEKMLASERPDIVVICSPSGMHCMHALLCMEAGAHVLCEKPMALHSRDAVLMIETAAKLSRKLFIVKQNRYNQPVQIAKKLLDNGSFGKVHGFLISCCWNRNAQYYNTNHWRGSVALDGGILYTQFSHFIDLLYWFLGDLHEAKGWRANYCHQDIIKFEDTGSASLLMTNGAMGSLFYTINAHESNMEGSFSLFGERGTMKIGGQYLNRIDHFSVDQQRLEQWTEQIPQSSFPSHTIVYQELLKTLQDPAHPFINATEAMQSLIMIEKIYNGSPMVP